MKRLTLYVLALLLPMVAQAQSLGGTGIQVSGPSLILQADGTYTTPTGAPLESKAGTSASTTRPGGLLCVNTTSASTAGTNEEVIGTCTIPGGTLANAGDTLRVVSAITTAATTDAKTFRVRWGGIGGTVAAALGTSSSAAPVRSEVSIVRTGASTQVVAGIMNGTPVVTTSAQTLANDITVVVTGDSTVIGDITFNMMLVYLDRAP